MNDAKRMISRPWMTGWASPRKTAATAFEVSSRRWSVACTIFYDITITGVCLRCRCYQALLSCSRVHCLVWSQRWPIFSVLHLMVAMSVYFSDTDCSEHGRYKEAKRSCRSIVSLCQRSSSPVSSHEIETLLPARHCGHFREAQSAD